MKEYFLFFLTFLLGLFFFFTLGSQNNVFAVGAGQICKNSGNCPSGFVCKIANPQECAAIGGKDPAACKTTCQKKLSSKGGDCKGNGDCANGYICVLINPNECATIGGKDPAACNKWCQPAPPVKKGGKCDGITFKCASPNVCTNGTCQTPPPACNADGQACSEGAQQNTLCPAGYTCGGFPANCLHTGVCDGTCSVTPGGVCDKNKKKTSNALPPPPSPPCKQWSNGMCTSVDTAVGGLATDPTGFIKSIFDVLLSVSGGIALLLIIKSGYQLMTSQGKPEAIQNGRDQLIAAIVGLAFLIFSFVILQVIGFDILKIPGFGQ